MVTDHLSQLTQEKLHLIERLKTSRLKAKSMSFFYNDPYLFNYYSNQIIRKCVPNSEISSVLKFCHMKSCGGHFSTHETMAKIL